MSYNAVSPYFEIKGNQESALMSGFANCMQRLTAGGEGHIIDVDCLSQDPAIDCFSSTASELLNFRSAEASASADDARIPGRPGRPRKHADLNAGRRAANRRNAERHAAAGCSQRSVTLPRQVWLTLRATRKAGESSDAQTLERLITAAER